MYLPIWILFSFVQLCLFVICLFCIDQPRPRDSINFDTITCPQARPNSKLLSLTAHISRLAYWISVIKILFKSPLQDLSIETSFIFELRLVQKLSHFKRRLSFLTHFCTWNTVPCPQSLATTWKQDFKLNFVDNLIALSSFLVDTHWPICKDAFRSKSRGSQTSQSTCIDPRSFLIKLFCPS